MYAHRITPKMVTEAILLEIKKDSQRKIRVIYGPFSDGIIDIIPSSESFGMGNDIERVSSHLINHVFEEFSIKSIKGITEISQLYPKRDRYEYTC